MPARRASEGVQQAAAEGQAGAGFLDTTVL